MKFNFYTTFISLIIILQASCTNRELLESQSTDLKSNYHDALVVGYRNLAIWEEKKYDWQASDHFAKKGLRAKRNISVGLEDPTERNIKDADYLDELLFYRLEFSKLQTDEIKVKFALEAASLQILYDSWVEQTEENPNEKTTLRFRKEFIEGYRQLKKSIKILRDEQLKAEKLTEKNLYTIYFDQSKSNLDITAIKELNKLAYYLKRLPKYKLVIEGHTDKLGAVDNNIALSRKRVMSTRDKLIELGVKRENILKENAYGETKQDNKSEQGYADRVNRRVEIFVLTDLK
ncbi:MAG: OmpA family protein [Rickettsiales bacterium]|jgi:outer membrane protein OmpA-like peptidoglycan-associated protein|nr:OmpA family protein [Rickettsiales bacterium]